MTYIGQTKRNIRKRFKEHQACLRYANEDKSAIAKHALHTNHSFATVNLLKEVQNYKYLDAWETLYIKKNQNYLVNNEPGPLVDSPFLNFI